MTFSAKPALVGRFLRLHYSRQVGACGTSADASEHSTRAASRERLIDQLIDVRSGKVRNEESASTRRPVTRCFGPREHSQGIPRGNLRRDRSRRGPRWPLCRSSAGKKRKEGARNRATRPSGRRWQPRRRADARSAIRRSAESGETQTWRALARLTSRRSASALTRNGYRLAVPSLTEDRQPRAARQPR
jgi:hypothetical protein